MSEFSVNTDKINSIADLLEQQARILSEESGSISSAKNRLHIQGLAGAQVKSAVQATSDRVKADSAAAQRMGQTLKKIAEAYRNAENHILGSAQSGFSGGGGNSSGGGGTGSGEHGGGGRGFDGGASIFSSDPVNLNSGNFILDNHDMELPGFQPLVFRRFYNSIGTFTGMLGKDWNTGFEMKILTLTEDYVPGTNLKVVLEDGREEIFVSSDGKRFAPVSGTTAELTYQENGFVYQTLDGDRHIFNQHGRYIRYENIHQLGFDLIYEDGMLTQVKKDSGEYFALSYDENGLLSLVEDHTGRSCRYEFSEEHLSNVTLPDGNSYQYFYNPSGKIWRVINPRQVGAVETEYDSLFRVTYQKFADGTTNQFEYMDEQQAVAMTERNGSRSVHYHNEKYRNIRNVYLDGEEVFEYNERGQKTVITDKRGNITRLQYDNKGNVTNVLTAGGTKIAATYNQQNRLLTLSVNGRKKLHNQYNAFGDLLCTQDGLGRETAYEYDPYGRVTAARMPDGTVMGAEYDQYGNLSAVKQPDGGVLTFEYDELNQMIQQTNAMGQTTGYSYDVMGRITAEIRPDGYRKQYQYDEWGNLVSVTDFDGSVETRVYNENNKPVSMTDAAGRTTYFEYDSMWNIAKAALPNGGVFTYTYDMNNYLQTVCDAEGGETHFEYDPMGNIISRIDAEGAETRYEWDEDGRCIKTIAADGSETEYQYNEDDEIIYVKDAEGVELFRNFDEAGQLISERDSLGKTRSYTYNVSGELISMVDEKRQTISYQYEKELHKLKEIGYPDGSRKQYSYDANGNLKTYTDIYGVTSRYQYDELNRLIAVTGDQGKTSEYRYDLAGRLISEKDAEGNTIQYEYSITGQLSAVTDALGNRTCYTYDEMNELTGVLRKLSETEAGAKLNYERNLMGEITKITDALGETETYRYDKLGHMLEKTDRSGQSTIYAYNQVGLLQSVQWADDRKADYQYSPLRRLNKISDWTGVTTLEYDGAGNPLKIVYPDHRELEFTYDSCGNRTKVMYPNGGQADCEYDAFDRLSKIVYGDFSVAYTYNQMGKPEKRSLSDGTETQYCYHPQGMLSEMIHKDAQGVLDHFSYTYDSLGRRKKQDVFRREDIACNGSYEYDYDPVGRLAQVVRDGQEIRRYAYDSQGNRSSLTNIDPLTGKSDQINYEYDLRGGLLKTIGNEMTEEYRYDPCGNLTALLQNGQISMTYRYDVLNRLEQTKTNKGDEASYQYNGLGYRTGMSTLINGQKKSVSYVLDYSRIYDNLLEAYTADETEAYIWGSNLEGFASGKDSYGTYETDPQGSVIRTSNSSGNVWLKNYDEFGNISQNIQNKTGLTDFGYHGFAFDPVAGTYFAQARQYRSNTGTFDGMDRIAGDITMPDTLNLYSYCAYDPLNRTDKSGYWFGFDDLIAAGVGAVGGLAGTLAGDIVDGITTGNFELSSWQKYMGSAIGGAAGGVTTLYAGPIAGGAVAGGVSRLSTEGLTWASDPDSYNKSFGQVLGETVIDAGMGAASGAVSKFVGKATKGLANSKVGQWFVSKLDNGGKLSTMIANHITDIAHGKSSKAWSVVSKILKNQHGAISTSPELRNQLFKVLLGGLPVYLGQEIISKFIDKIKPSKVIWNIIKGDISGWLKKLIGVDDSGTQCAAAA